jgi:hypothetical protein
VGLGEFCLFWNEKVSQEQIIITDSDQLEEIYITHAIKNIPLSLTIKLLERINPDLVANETFKSCYPESISSNIGGGMSSSNLQEKLMHAAAKQSHVLDDIQSEFSEEFI